MFCLFKQMLCYSRFTNVALFIVIICSMMPLDCRKLVDFLIQLNFSKISQIIRPDTVCRPITYLMLNYF